MIARGFDHSSGFLRSSIICQSVLFLTSRAKKRYSISPKLASISSRSTRFSIMMSNMTNTNATLCWKCQAPLAKAMVRCRQCGAPKNPPGNSHSSSANPSPGKPAVKSENALSLDDMFSMAEDVQTADSIDDFVSQASQILKRPEISVPKSAQTQNPVTRQRSAESTASNTNARPTQAEKSQTRSLPSQGSTTAHQHPTEKSPDDSDNGSSSSSHLQNTPSIPKRRTIPKTTGNLAEPNAASSRRRRSAESDQSSEKSGPTRAITQIIKQALRMPAPKVRLDEKELKKRQKEAARLIAKSQKTIAKYQDDDTKPAIDALRQVITELSATQDSSVIAVIQPFLQDKRPSIPETAIRGLSNTRCPEAFEPLISLLLEMSPEHAAGVLTALGTLRDRRAVQTLVAYGAEYPQYQLRVIESLVDIGKDAIPTLIELAGSEEAGEQLIACVAMGKSKDERCLESLIQLLSHQASTLRCQAAEALGELGDTKAIRALVPLLKDPDANVRTNVAAALCKLPDERVVSPLMKSLKDQETSVRAYAIQGLGVCGDKTAVPALLDILNNNDDPELLLATCDALGRLGDPHAVDHLIQFLVVPESREHQSLVLKVIDTVRRLQSPKAVPALFDLLQSPETNIRLKTVEAIGQCKDKAAAEPLESFLAKDSSDEVRAAVAKAIGEIGDPESLPALVEALQDTFNVRLRSIIAMGAIKNPNAIPSLMPLLKDQSPEIRYHACQTLAELDHKKALHHIEPLAADEVPMVSRGALKAMQKLGDTRPEKQILAAAKKRNKSKKAAVTTSIGSSGGLLNFSELLSDGVMGVLWPESVEKRLMIGGVLGTLIIVPILLAGYFSIFGAKDYVVMRGVVSGEAFSSDGNSLYVSTIGGSLERWNDVNAENYSSKLFVNISGLADVICIKEDVQIVAGRSGELFRVESSNFQSIQKFDVELSSLQLSHDASTFAVIDAVGNFYTFNSETMAPGGVLGLTDPSIICKKLTPDGKGVLVGYNKGTIRIMDMASAISFEMNIKKEILDVAISSDGKQLAVSTKGNVILIYDKETKALVSELKAEDVTQPAYRLWFFEDNKKILAAQSGATIWTLEDKSHKNIPSESGEFRISPDGKKAVGKVGEESEYVFELLDLENAAMLSQPEYRFY